MLNIMVLDSGELVKSIDKNTVDINSDPPHVEGLHSDGIGFHGHGEFHRVTSLYLPVVISVTSL